MGKIKEGKGCPKSQEKPPIKKELRKKAFKTGERGRGGGWGGLRLLATTEKFLTYGDVDEFLVVVVIDLHCFVEVLPKIRIKI